MMNASPIAYKKANHALNIYATQIDCGPVRYRVHYWGFMPQHYHNTLHRHSFFEMCYVMEGSGEYIDDGKHYPLSSGTSFCSRPGIWHQIRSDEGLALCYVAFDIIESDSADAYARAYQVLAQDAVPVIPSAEKSATAALWGALLYMFDNANGQGQAAYPIAVLQSTAGALLYSMLPLFAPHTYQLPEVSIGAANISVGTNDLFRRACLYLADNLSEPLSLEIVAQHLHISPRHLSRLFMQHGGQTFVHYVQERRIQLAKELLLDTDAAIKHIAAQCGFESVHYFTRVFTQLLGVSPARYRRRYLHRARPDTDPSQRPNA
ncbi:AraC family transcriptional regulator [Paenibacillus sp. chi10]|uniref:AraC family transcriptional regulator n=1 Tax=Paenibacillus suaedae TaxID=3077233 RepID=A0AAJ2K4H6_9BACL|nr:AraC family transcriptional regulator [Paenibacillus sp. chi10]MDT8979912.1 AraC family transcriptional regulator [Paenibacillus sp. chi10]